MPKLIGREIMAACGLPDMISDDSIRKMCSKGCKLQASDKQAYDWEEVGKDMLENMPNVDEEVRLMLEGTEGDE